MALFKQFANVIAWEEWKDDMIFHKWNNNEIKKGSRLILKPGQDAIFLYNGKIEGVFTDDGDYDIDSEIIPFLSTLKGFKFGFKSGMSAEVLFVNTKELLVNWGTASPINIQAPGLPGGIPIRANGTLHVKVDDYVALIDKLAGVKREYSVKDVKDRINSFLSPLLMKWISKEGKDMFNLQASAYEISKGIKEDLDFELVKDGLTVTTFNVLSFNYPAEVQAMINKTASQSMVGDVNKYATIAMADGMGKGGSSTAGDMASIMMGMEVAKNMVGGFNSGAQQTQQQPQQTQQQPQQQQSTSGGELPKFCPECGTKASGGKFCSNCGNKLG
ncbi:MAG: SPFH domain-containing protein [Bacillota bacterium]